MLKNTIIFILPKFSMNCGTFTGGAEKNIVEVCNQLSCQGYYVHIIVFSDIGKHMHNLDNKLKIINLNNKKTFGILSILFNAVPKLFFYLIKSKPRHIVCVDHYAALVGLLAKYLSLSRSKIFISVRNSIYYKSYFFSRFNFLINLFYSRFHMILPVSYYIRNEILNLIRLPESKLKVIYNPVIKKDIFKLSREPLVHPWFNNQRMPVIVSIGRLSKQKDFFTLIKAFNLVSKSYCVRLVILGEGSERNNLENFIFQLNLSHCIDLPGYVTNPYPYIKHCNLFVLSSIWEGLPTVLIEAMALNPAVISTDCAGGSAEILNGYPSSSLIPVGDYHQLAQAIIDKLNNKPAKFFLSNWKHFTSNNITKQWLSILD